MGTEDRNGRSPASERLEQEHRQVMTAIHFVAGGGGARVRLAGLHFAQELLAGLSGEAAASGVVLEPHWWPEDAGCDLVVRQADRETPAD